MPRPTKPKPEASTGPRLVRRTTAAKAKPAAPPAHADVTHEQIAMRAYEYFLQEGGAHGHHVDHWLRAELDLKTVPQQPVKRVATRARG